LIHDTDRDSDGLACWLNREVGGYVKPESYSEGSAQLGAPARRDDRCAELTEHPDHQSLDPSQVSRLGCPNVQVRHGSYRPPHQSLERFNLRRRTITSTATTTVFPADRVRHRPGPYGSGRSTVTSAGASGDYLWWSAGDHETTGWHGLDLRMLT